MATIFRALRRQFSSEKACLWIGSGQFPPIILPWLQKRSSEERAVTKMECIQIRIDGSQVDGRRGMVILQAAEQRIPGHPLSGRRNPGNPGGILDTHFQGLYPGQCSGCPRIHESSGKDFGCGSGSYPRKSMMGAMSCISGRVHCLSQLRIVVTSAPIFSATCT